MAQAQGAVLIGKAATSEFATQSPGPTRNPLDLDRTPGGSSSGSAAAVADFMVPVAFGTQTTGSIIRPAAYCGIVGYKPSHGLISTAGVKMLSPLHDTVGVLARSVVDAALFTFGLHGMHATHAPEAPKRLIVCESNAWDHASLAVVNAIESAVRMLERAGVQVRRVTLSANFEEVASLQTRLVAFEAHQALSHERLCDSGRLSKRLQQRLAAGAKTHLQEYLAMRRKVDAAKANVGHLFGDADAILYPSADGEAETGLDESGSPRYGALWTLLNLPCVAFPIGMGPSGMPLGAQLIGRCYDDVKLLAATAFASCVVGS